MPYETLTCEQKGQIITITLNRPGAKNTINDKMATELIEVCSQISQDKGIMVVIITGSGEEAFSGGTEPKGSFPEQDKGNLASWAEGQVPMTRYPASTVAELDCPVLAAINGDALGQGLELALACDIRIACEGAKFGFPDTGLNLIPRDGGTQRLPRIVGKGKALEIILTGELIDAAEAYRIGLVNAVVPHKELLPRALEWAMVMTTKAPIALRYAKQAVCQGLDLTLEQGLQLEANLYFLLHTTEDRTEGIRAFLEKRPPQFRGR